jgi:hypothetical protein
MKRIAESIAGFGKQEAISDGCFGVGARTRFAGWLLVVRVM